MTVSDNDIFGQIDALLGKRSPSVLSENNSQGDDFPRLTEVINVEIKDQPNNLVEKYASDSRVDNRHGERRLSDRRRQANFNMSNAPAEMLPISLLDAMEIKMTEMFSLQQERLERAFRLMVQEESSRKK